MCRKASRDSPEICQDTTSQTCIAGYARGLKTESGRLGTKAEPGGWRIRVTLLCQRAEVEPGDLRTKAELRAGKTEVEPEVMRTTMELKGWWC